MSTKALRELRMPVVTTFHTILKDPNPDQRRVQEEIVSLSDRVVVMSERGLEFLQEVYHVPPEKIDLIPHGIPDVSFVAPSFHKDLFGVEGKSARFDQQPVEAQAMVSACLAAYRFTGEKSWHSEACRAFEWFLGRNDLHLPVYDPTTGGCRDGLHLDRPNENQGAESTLAYLQSLLELRLAESGGQLNEYTHNEASTHRSVSTLQI